MELIFCPYNQIVARRMALAHWKEKVRSQWQRVHITDVVHSTTEGLSVGSRLPVSATVYLGDLTPDDVSVEVYFGPLDPDGVLRRGRAAEMKHVLDLDGGQARFDG